MKLKTVYICQECEFQSSKWQGKCPDCSAWNSFAEDVINVGKAAPTRKAVVRPATAAKPQNFSQSRVTAPRIKTGIAEFDQVAGGGLVEGSLVLLSGEPGIGKSTITLQLLEGVAEQREKLLYITGEESVEQVADRAKRLGCVRENMQLLYETSLENIIASVESVKPDFLVLDSIQVISSDELPGTAGSISQVRAVCEAIMSLIKSRNIPTLLIGHVNKDGKIAGPKVLEHLVDAVFILEGERDQSLRMLRAIKNRYGTVSEVGLFEMGAQGLQEVSNMTERVLGNRPKEAHGSCLTLAMEGNRPLLMEVQALVSHTSFGYPKRAASGFDRNRLELLIAVLQKHSGLNLLEQDVYVNVVGGLQLKDRSADLAVCLAIASSLLKTPLPQKLVAYGEIGLTGEIRPAFRGEDRNKAVDKMKLKAPAKWSSLREALQVTRS